MLKVNKNMKKIIKGIQKTPANSAGAFYLV